MRHGFLDQDAYLDSPIHRLDARAKILGFLGAIVVYVSTPPQAYASFAVYAASLALLVALSRLPVLRLLRRSLVVVPFVLMVVVFAPFLEAHGTGGGYNLGIRGGDGIVAATPGMVVWNAAAKSFLSALTAILLTSTTPFAGLLQGFRRLHVPQVIVMLLSFAYRYLFVLVDELHRLRLAHDARGYRGRWLWHASSLGHLVGALFLRTYERGERVYLAMVSRGFEGRFHYLPAAPMRPADAVFLAAFLGAVLASRLVLS